MRQFFLVAAFALAIAACSMLSPEQQANALDALDLALQQGTISPTQHAAAVEAIRNGGTSELARLGSELLRSGIDVGLALLGVRVLGPRLIRGATPKTGGN